MRTTWFWANLRYKNYYTVLKGIQEYNFENEGDPHLYGSYIQKPVA